MISNLSIWNFRSNNRLKIDLDPHVTSITGESYTGKSNALRAIKWVALNRPAGTRMIRWRKKLCSVSLTVDNHRIVRQRSKSINRYIVDGHKLEAFGNDVPDSVRKILNLSDINFQIQQEVPHGDGPLFWFALTPGQVSKRLNQIVNLEVIDRTLGNLQTEVNRAHATLEVCRTRRKEAKEQAESLAFVEQMAKEWEDAVKAQKRYERLEREASELDQLLQGITRQKAVTRTAQRHLNRADRDLKELESLRKTIIEIDREHKDLSRMIDEIERLEQDRSEALRVLKMAQDEYDKALGKRCPLCGRK